MNKILQSEHLKQKHTFQKKLIYLAPLVSIAIAFVLMGGYYIQKSAYNWWYTLILPGSFTMITMTAPALCPMWGFMWATG